MDEHLCEVLKTPHEGISKVYAKTVSVNPINDEFFIPEVIVTEYKTDNNGTVVDETLTCVSDEII